MILDADLNSIIIIALLWVGYFLIHSFTASLSLKRWVADLYPGLMPAYRLAFNALSVLLLIPVLWLSFIWRSEPLWHFGPVLHGLSIAITLLTILAFYYSLRYYDMDEFIGRRQWRERNSTNPSAVYPPCS